MEKIKSNNQSIRVLLVDDDISYAEVTANILQLNNAFEVDLAFDVNQALDKLKSQFYDVIVSDYEMPGKNGLDFLKEIKESRLNIPFILLTGKGREEVIVDATNLGADGYYSKSGSPETVYGELSRNIKAVVNKKEAERRGA